MLYLANCGVNLPNMSESSLDPISRVDLVEKSLTAGVWDWDIDSGEEWWSDNFFELLGYQAGELIPSFDNWLNHILDPVFKSKVEQAIRMHLEHQEPYKVQVRMKHKTMGYRWYETSGVAEFNASDRPIRMAGIIRDIHAEKMAYEKLAFSEVLLSEGSAIAKLGVWRVDLNEMQQEWSDQIFQIHDMPIGPTPSVEEGINSFAENHRLLIQEVFTACVNEGKPYDVQLQIITAKKELKWVRAIGKPDRDNQGNIVGVFGVFQDIDAEKKRELEMDALLTVIQKQNARLLNFAHIVSHNLRSHGGNLDLMLNLMDENITEEERNELIDQFKGISKGLNDTIYHLNEVVKIQTYQKDSLDTVNMEEAVYMALSIIQPQLDLIKAVVTVELEWKVVEYIRAYMDSVLLNLMSNAVKYRHENRTLELRVITDYKDGVKRLIVEDNGLGMDLGRVGDKLFGMYKTFHEHEDSRGIGLFITRNQIESLDGEILVESEVGRGTRFIVLFN